jgi:hypothetical protein
MLCQRKKQTNKQTNKQFMQLPYNLLNINKRLLP